MGKKRGIGKMFPHILMKFFSIAAGSWAYLFFFDSEIHAPPHLAKDGMYPVNGCSKSI